MQLIIDGVLRNPRDMMYLMLADDDEVNEVEDGRDLDKWNQYYDDISGNWLNTEFVKKARSEEMQVF